MSKLTNLMFLVAALTGCATDGGEGPGPGPGGDGLPEMTDGVSTLSGFSEAGYVDGPRGTARFANPVNVAYGPDGMVYVADFDNGKIRVVDPEDGSTSTTIAKQGFQRPFGMTFAADGALYVSTDRDPEGGHSLMSGTIWRIDTETGNAMPVAVGIGRPRGIAALSNGQIAAVDYSHHVVQLVDPASGQVTPLAGSWDAKGMANGAGEAAKFSTPYGVVEKDGNLIVADYDNNRLRQVSLDGTVTTLVGDAGAGFADGAMGSAKFNKPQGLAIADNGDIFVSDLENYRIRRISGSNVETIAGSGSAGWEDSDDRLAAKLYGLEGLSVTPDGAKVFVADGGRGENVPYNFIRSIKLK